jgi:rhamnogalacturonyl hydrolase YesR
MRKWPDPGREIAALNKVWHSNLWTRAVYYEGLIAFNKTFPAQNLYDYAVQWGNAHKWTVGSGKTSRHADNHCCGQTYLALYELEKKPEQLRCIKDNIDAMLATEKIDDWSWIDALQMAMPVYAKLGVLTGDKRYFERMHAMYEFTRNRHGGNGLYNPVEHLWWRDKDFVPPYKEPNGKNCYWSRGNGWVLGGIVRILQDMPANYPARNKYEQVFKEVCSRIASLQGKDGLWRSSLLDPDEYPSPETSGSGFFCYALAWGINNHLLAADQFLPVVAKAWEGLNWAVDKKTGMLGWVQAVGADPRSVSADETQEYGAGAFCLAGSELVKLAK